MRHLFISYARENKPSVEALIRDLDVLGYQTWVDFALRGGQTWWDEIIRRIAASDVFVAIVSPQELSSVACQRELEWALALGKPVLPLSIGRLPDALPRALSMRQIIDYSASSREAAFALAGALANLPDAPPPPDPLPEAPPAPLSYLSDLIERVAQPEPLTHEQQREVLVRLQPALHSSDDEERQGGRYILDMLSRRDDLFADVDRSVEQLAQVGHDTAAATAPTPLPPAVAAASPRGGPGLGVKIALAAVGVLLIAAVIAVAALMTRGGQGDRGSVAGSASPTQREVTSSVGPPMSSEPEPPAVTTSRSASLTGTWSGVVSGDQSLKVIADIVDGPSLTAQVRYPEINCDCTWTEKPSASAGVRLLTEKVVSGSCVPSEITLVPQDDGTLHLSSTYYSKAQQRNLTIEGTLTRNGG